MTNTLARLLRHAAIVLTVSGINAVLAWSIIVLIIFGEIHDPLSSDWHDAFMFFFLVAAFSIFYTAFGYLFFMSLVFIRSLMPIIAPWVVIAICVLSYLGVSYITPFGSEVNMIHNHADKIFALANIFLFAVINRSLLFR